MAAQEATGKTVEEAAAKALALLGCTRDEAKVEVLEAPSKGFFGLFGAHPAKVRVTRKEASKAEMPKESPAPVKKMDPVPAGASVPVGKETKDVPADHAADRPWMPPDESGAIDTPYSEQRSYGVTATTPPADAKPFGDNRRNNRRDSDGERCERRPRRERSAERRDRRRFDDERHDHFDEEAPAAAPKKPAAPAVPVTPDYEGVADDDLTPRQCAEKFLCEVFRCMGLDVQMTLQETDEGSVYNLQGDGLGILIGKHGQTLDALQYLTNLAANKGREDGRIHVVLDAMDYRSRREETLRRLAGHLAEKACRIHAEVRLEPMNRHERKIIHMALQENGRVSTYSDGDEPYRCVVIAPKKKRRYRPRRERNAESAERVEEE